MKLDLCNFDAQRPQRALDDVLCWCSSAGTTFVGTNLDGASFEDALIGNEDVKRLCVCCPHGLLLYASRATWSALLWEVQCVLQAGS